MSATQEIKGDIWDKYKEGFWVVIPTNGFVKNNGEVVMGRGLALQVKNKIKDLPFIIGSIIKDSGNNPIIIPKYKIITLPVKYNWWENANLQLIEESIKTLLNMMSNDFSGIINSKVYLPRIGCGNGKLEWNTVKPILEKYLDERFVVCDINGR